MSGPPPKLGRPTTPIDQVLDVRQQAQFRVFEELMERRKIDLVTRARQKSEQPSPAPGQQQGSFLWPCPPPNFRLLSVHFLEVYVCVML